MPTVNCTLTKQLLHRILNNFHVVDSSIFYQGRSHGGEGVWCGVWHPPPTPFLYLRLIPLMLYILYHTHPFRLYNGNVKHALYISSSKWLHRSASKPNQCVFLKPLPSPGRNQPTLVPPEFEVSIYWSIFNTFPKPIRVNYLNYQLDLRRSRFSWHEWQFRFSFLIIMEWSYFLFIIFLFCLCYAVFVLSYW